MNSTPTPASPPAYHTNIDIHISKLHTSDSDVDYHPETCYGCGETGFDYNDGENSMDFYVLDSIDGDGVKWGSECHGFICYACISKNDRESVSLLEIHIQTE